MKTIITILTLSFAIVAKGQTNKVDIDIFNSTTDTLTVYVTESRTGAMTDIGNNLFTPERVMPGTSLKKKEVRVTRYSIIKVWGELLKKGGKTETIQEIVQKDMKTFNKTLAVQIDPSNQKDIVTLSTVANKYKYNPSLFYEKKDLSPKPIQGLFNQYLGSIIAYTEAGDSIKIERRIFPSTIGTIDRVHFGTQTNIDEFIINGETNQSANGNIPMFGELGVSIEADNTYEVRLSYRGIGVIDWENHNKIDIDKAFFKLSDTTLYVLGELRERFPALNLDIIDKAFVFDGIFAEVIKMNKLSISNNVNASTFFNNKGYFNKETKALSSEAFGSSYIGFWSSRTVNLSGALDLATYVYTNKKIIELQNQENAIALSDYSKLRETNPSLPDLKTKKEIEEFYTDKNKELMKIHEIAPSLDLKFKNEIKNNDIKNLEDILKPNTIKELEKKFRNIEKQ
jgi:hypothetical protein